jgi:hypothetical protein
VGSLTSHNPTGLQGLLRGELQNNLVLRVQIQEILRQLLQGAMTSNHSGFAFADSLEIVNTKGLFPPERFIYLC